MAKDAYYFSHDSNAKDDPKCTLLIEQLGLEGYGIYWILIEVLRDQPDYKYPIALIPALARKYNTTAEKTKTVINGYGLFVVDERDFFSNSLLDRMGKYTEKRDKAKLAANKRWNKSLCESNANAMPTQCECNADPMPNKVNESKVNESKVNESKVNLQLNSNRTFFTKSQICNNCNFEYDSHGNECPIWIDKEIKDTCFNFKKKQQNVIDSSKLCTNCNIGDDCVKQKMLNCKTCPTWKPKEG
jgi:hypothetical protein